MSLTVAICLQSRKGLIRGTHKGQLRREIKRIRQRVCTMACTMALAFAADASAAGNDSDPWRRYVDPHAAGWSRENLSAAKGVAENVGSMAVVAVHRGHVVAAWGEIDRPTPLYSMRKGMYNALYGVAVAKGLIDLNATLAELDVDDIGGLSETERSATVEHILQSRSGVYHAAAFEHPSMKRRRPERGSRAPGEHWFYNNWDFNLAGSVLEQATARGVGELFRDWIAQPLGLQDYQIDHVFSFYEPSRSRYHAPLIRLSARDAARVGQLYLQGGMWAGKRILSKDWIERTWTMHTVFEEDNRFGAGNGFGYLWWIYPKRDGATSTSQQHDVFITRGVGGQVVAVVPSMDLVMVHMTDRDNTDGVDFSEAVRVINAVMSAYTDVGDSLGNVATTAVKVEPLPNVQPAAPRREAIPWTKAMIAAVVGEYRLNPKISMKVHAVGGRVFAQPQGAPLAEVELFTQNPDVIFSPAVDLVLSVHRDDAGRVTELTGRFDGNPGRAVRIAK